MILKEELQIYTGKDQKRSISFGVATEEDLDEIYRLKFEVYSHRNYIIKENFPDKKEFDEYDLKGKCKYFIAKIDNKLIGCVRLIFDNPLPTEEYFSFTPPEEIEKISPPSRCELGRLVIVPPNREKKDYLPRRLVMLFLIDVLSNYGIENNILGGYAFIKRSLEEKLEKLRMPMNKISNFTTHYPPDGILYKYFTQKDDPVIPIYFITSKFHEYTQRYIRSPFLFKRINNTTLVMKSNLYTKFLKALKII